MEQRYAIYYAPPPATPLARFAAAWLGRCPDAGTAGPRPPIAGLSSDQLDRLVAEPARYGFHGTLKAPFRLAAGKTAPGLRKALSELASGLPAFDLPPLRLTAIGSFIALVPDAPSDTLSSIADACVMGLDPFRAPSTEAELAKRRRARLSARQEAMLARWGYPYVLEEFQFHLTLTGRLDATERERLLAGLAPLVAPFCRQPMPFTDMALFVEPAPGAPFRLEERFPLAGAAPDRSMPALRAAPPAS